MHHWSVYLVSDSVSLYSLALRKTTRNATSVLTAIGKDKEIPVYVGASRALRRPCIHAPSDIHGESGIDGTSLLPEPRTPADTSIPAVDATARALKAEAPGTAWLVATGSFTNVATLLQKYPDLVDHIRGLSLMGGAIGGGFTKAVMGYVDGVPRIGNWTQFAEFNVLADPEAAAWIFTNKALAAKTTLIPLDVTHQVLATKEIQSLLLWGAQEGGDRIGSAKTTLRTMLVELLLFFAKTYRFGCHNT
jgi:uridine nucleosidase